MAVAIALHNVPEGIIIAAPIFAATGSRWKALGWATASVGAHTLGALWLMLTYYGPLWSTYVLVCNTPPCPCCIQFPLVLGSAL
eukprot:scaffold174862_cov30-Tisochrysis_lutea.AAC.1